MPTRKQLSLLRESEMEFPETRRVDDPLYKTPAIPKQEVDDTFLNFSDWIKRKHNDLDKAGDGYESLSELSKNCIDYAIKRYIEWIRKQKVDDIDLRDKISDILFDSNGHCGGSANVFNYLQKHYTLTRKQIINGKTKSIYPG